MNAAESFAKGWKHFLECIDFGKSNLDAEAICFMNEVPGYLLTALTKLELLVENSKHREDEINGNMEIGCRGGYSEQLTEAIEVLDKIKGES